MWNFIIFGCDILVSLISQKIPHTETFFLLFLIKPFQFQRFHTKQLFCYFVFFITGHFDSLLACSVIFLHRGSELTLGLRMSKPFNETSQITLGGIEVNKKK